MKGPLFELDPPLWQELLNDIVAEIVDWLIVGLEEELERLKYYVEYHPGTLGMVCRRWRNRFKPYLYRAVKTPRSIDAMEAVSIAQTHNWPYRHATKLSLDWTQHLSPSVLRKLPAALPSVQSTVLYHINWNDAACAHPSW